MTDTVRPRIDRYLSETGLAAQGAKVVPLTGDASDRRYFRILLREARHRCLPSTRRRSTSSSFPLRTSRA